MRSYITLDAVPDLPIDPDAMGPHVQALQPGERSEGDFSSMANALRGSYDTPESSDITAKLAQVGTLDAEFRDEFTKIHDAVSDFARELVTFKQERKRIVHDILEFRSRTGTWAAQQRSYEPSRTNLTDAEILDQFGGPRRHYENDELHSRCQKLDRDLDYELGYFEKALASLHGPKTFLPSGHRSQPARFSASHFRAQQDATYMQALLNALEHAAGEPPTALALAAFLKSHPDLADRLRKSVAPQVVAQWWTKVKSPENEALYGALAAGATTIVGNLGGVPPLDRVEINKLTAARTLAQVKSELARYPKRDRNGRSIEAPSSLRDKASYLESVVAGNRQLYGYDPYHDRIVEMIGDPAHATTTVTYVPGTGVNFNLFYSGAAQRVSKYFVDVNADASAPTVAFVYMDGPGPTWPGVSLDRTNVDPNYASAFGKHLAEFQASLDVSAPNLAASYKIGIGHSAGETGLSASEIYGARYDYHASLAGAWQLWDWKPVDGTKYGHYSYGIDALDIISNGGVKEAAKMVPVAGTWASIVIESPAHMPVDSAAFDKFNFPSSDSILANHNRAALGPDQNFPLLRALIAEARKDRGF